MPSKRAAEAREGREGAGGLEEVLFEVRCRSGGSARLMPLGSHPAWPSFLGTGSSSCCGKTLILTFPS
jgi:hypothetical protein